MRTAWTDCPRWLNLMLIAALFVACRTATAMNWRLALVSVRSAWLITLEATATRFALRLSCLSDI